MYSKRTRVLLSLVAIAVGIYLIMRLFGPGRTQVVTDESGNTTYEIVTLLPKDAIPSIDNPSFVEGAEADAQYHDDELVLGVEIDGEARAYSVPFLSGHEIVNGVVTGGQAVAYPHSLLAERLVVNDTVDTQPLLVLFEPDSRTAQVFSRQVGEQTLTFMPSSEPDVVVDEETGTGWFVLTGRAVSGPLTGEALQRLPSTNSFWFGWKDFYPETLVYGVAANTS
jgi:hypothetical protein